MTVKRVFAITLTEPGPFALAARPVLRPLDRRNRPRRLRNLFSGVSELLQQSAI